MEQLENDERQANSKTFRCYSFPELDIFNNKYVYGKILHVLSTSFISELSTNLMLHLLNSSPFLIRNLEIHSTTFNITLFPFLRYT